VTGTPQRRRRRSTMVDIWLKSSLTMTYGWMDGSQTLEVIPLYLPFIHWGIHLIAVAKRIPKLQAEVAGMSGKFLLLFTQRLLRPIAVIRGFYLSHHSIKLLWDALQELLSGDWSKHEVNQAFGKWHGEIIACVPAKSKIKALTQLDQQQKETLRKVMQDLDYQGCAM
jgi:hypothetical protein